MGYGHRSNRIQRGDQRALAVRCSAGLLLTHYMCQVSLTAPVALVSKHTRVFLWGLLAFRLSVRMRNVYSLGRFSDLLIAQIHQRWGRDPWVGEFRFQECAVTKLSQLRNNVNNRLSAGMDSCNEQARAVSLCLHKHVSHMSQAPGWQA